MKEREYKYIPKVIADLIDESESDQAMLATVTKVLQSKHIDIQSELDQLDDDSLRFKAACLAHKVEMEKVYSEQSLKMEKLINDCWDVMPLAKANAQKMADELQPFADKVQDLSVSINSIKEQMDHVNFYGMQGFLETAEKMSTMSDSSIEMLGFLAANFKR